MSPRVRTIVTLVAAACAAATVSSCGGSSGDDRPTAKEISSSLHEGKAAEAMGVDGGSLPAKVVDCMAAALHDSDLSDEALQALVDGDTRFEGSAADNEALQGVTSDISACTADAHQD